MILNRIILLSNVGLQCNINNSINRLLLRSNRDNPINLNEGLKKSFYVATSETTIKQRLNVKIPLVIATRNAGFFNKESGKDLWKSITHVSSAGKKKGRGKGKSFVKNLNIGQTIGVGEENIVLPGLNAPVLTENKIASIEEHPRDEGRAKKLEEIRSNVRKFRSIKLGPLERGWTSVNWGGRHIGPPVSETEGDSEKFVGFDTIILEAKTVKHMTGNLGLVRTSSLFVVTGNKKGCAGFTLVKGSSFSNATGKALRKVGMNLLYIDICEGNTVYHDFYCEFMDTKIFVEKKEEGYGLKCHRVIRAICEVLGIQNLHAKIEGSKFTQNITKAFFLGLLKQKTYQEMADETQLVVARVRPGIPAKILATPSNGRIRSSSEIDEDEELDIDRRFGMKGEVPIEREKFVPFYERLPSWERHLKKHEKIRNHEKVRRDLEAEYGEVRSFLTDKYPECRPTPRNRKWKSPSVKYFKKY